ncbi:MAG TPA: folate-binding protein [Planctomycetes bacterium]|nr:folate-binding protein [Planctomycetota bacterium]
MSESAIFDQCARLDEDHHLEVVTVSGSDSEPFLQRLISCDLNKVTDEIGCRGTLLGGKGRILAFFDVYRWDERFHLIVDSALSGVLRARLDRLVILEDVLIESGELAVISLQGPTSGAVIEQLDGDLPEAFLHCRPWRDGWIASRRRSQVAGFELVIPTQQLAPVEQQLELLGVSRCSAEDAERARIEGGFPRFGQEITDRSLPPEVGLEDSISYDKGCYSGQEVLARIRTYGAVNRQLRSIHLELPEGIDSASVAPGDPLERVDDEGKSPGIITSVARCPDGFALLASVKKTHIEVGTSLRWQGTSGAGSSLTMIGNVQLPFHP